MDKVFFQLYLNYIQTLSNLIRIHKCQPIKLHWCDQRNIASISTDICTHFHRNWGQKIVCTLYKVQTLFYACNDDRNLMLTWEKRKKPLNIQKWSTDRKQIFCTWSSSGIRLLFRLIGKYHCFFSNSTWEQWSCHIVKSEWNQPPSVFHQAVL